MRVGVPREVKSDEYRVALTPAGVHELVRDGHDVCVETGAGLGSSMSDEDYRRAGATIADSPDDVWHMAELILKVKEPIASEFQYLRRDLLVFTYLHLAANPDLAHALSRSGTTAIAYETVQLPDGSLPLLAPMSEVAGRLAAQVGAYYLLKTHGGRGVLMGGVPGTHPANVVVLGAGVAGSNAVAVAAGMHAQVTVLDLNMSRLAELDRHYDGRVRTLASTTLELEQAVAEADLVIGAVLVPGARAPRLVPSPLVARMRSGAVLVDIAIDQGGCFQDSRPTTHRDPVFRVHETLFYCVTNMPGAVPRTSTHALTNVTLPYARAIAANGFDGAAKRLPQLCSGLNVRGGEIVSAAVREALAGE